MDDQVILVDENDQAIGVMNKLEVHQTGQLHRAFSIFIFNGHEQLLLQQRAQEKYHTANLWSNTCCGHPRPEESTSEAAMRRLKEEMGIVTILEKKFDFVYMVELDNDLMEHEFDHVFIGRYNQQPIINPEEASAYKWVNIQDLKDEMELFPEKYTEWLKIAIKYF